MSDYDYMKIEDLETMQKQISISIKKKKDEEKAKKEIIDLGFTGAFEKVFKLEKEISTIEKVFAEEVVGEKWTIHSNSLYKEVRFVNYSKGRGYGKNQYHDFVINLNKEVIQKNQNVTDEEIEAVIFKLKGEGNGS